MNLPEKIFSIYSQLSLTDLASSGIVLQNDSDGKGDYIAEWNHPTLPRPTDEQLNSAILRIAAPTIVTMRQARLALLQTGMLASVNAAVAAADEATKITWEFSSEVQRNNALVSTLAAALNLTGQQIDDLFTLAATL